MSSITFIDKNLYNHKLKALKKYFKKSYKELRFGIIVKLAYENKIDGKYQVEIPTQELFKRVYGPMILKFSVKNDVAIIEDIEPGDILMACYKKELPIYNGLPYASKKDLDKIKIMEKLI